MMQLIKTKSGFMFALGANMESGEPNDRLVSWNDPKTKSWRIELSNQAGSMTLQKPLPADPIIDDRGAEITIYGPEFKATFILHGGPFVWGVIEDHERKAA